MKGNLRHREVGHYRFSLFAIPEGDHYRWRVNRMDLHLKNVDRFGVKLAEVMARNEPEAWSIADDYIRTHAAGA